MQKYKVIPIYVGGTGNRILNSGDIVTAADFEAPAEDLVKQGFLAPYNEDEAPAARHIETALDDDTEGNEKSKIGPPENSAAETSDKGPKAKKQSTK